MFSKADSSLAESDAAGEVEAAEAEATAPAAALVVLASWAIRSAAAAAVVTKSTGELSSNVKTGAFLVFLVAAFFFLGAPLLVPVLRLFLTSVGDTVAAGMTLLEGASCATGGTAYSRAGEASGTCGESS